MHRFRVLSILAIAMVVAGCESAPVTGRKQFMLVPESQAIEASKDAYAQFLAPIQKQGKLNDDAAMKARVDRITARLVAQAIQYRPETQSWDWQVAVIDDPKTLNAWCMAGGKMAIYSGIITQLNLTDDEIAQVMGHEIAHALAKHTAERMSTAMASDAALQIGAMLLGANTASTQMALQAAAVATTVGVQLPNSRQQESEADRIGIELAAKAGYDPHAAPRLWGKMIQASGSKGQSDFLSTHPQSEKRQEALSALIPQMMPYYDDKSPRPEYRFKMAFDPRAPRASGQLAMGPDPGGSKTGDTVTPSTTKTGQPNAESGASDQSAASSTATPGAANERTDPLPRPAEAKN